MPQHVEISIFPKESPSHSSRSSVLIAFVFSKLTVTFTDICLFFVFFHFPVRTLRDTIFDHPLQVYYEKVWNIQNMMYHCSQLSLIYTSKLSVTSFPWQCKWKLACLSLNKDTC